jgi:hypothetical protein
LECLNQDFHASEANQLPYGGEFLFDVVRRRVGLEGKRVCARSDSDFGPGAAGYRSDGVLAEVVVFVVVGPTLLR